MLYFDFVYRPVPRVGAYRHRRKSFNILTIIIFFSTLSQGRKQLIYFSLDFFLVFALLDNVNIFVFRFRNLYTNHLPGRKQVRDNTLFTLSIWDLIFPVLQIYCFLVEKFPFWKPWDTETIPFNIFTFIQLFFHNWKFNPNTKTFYFRSTNQCIQSWNQKKNTSFSIFTINYSLPQNASLLFSE